MSVDDKNCRECGASNWSKVAEMDYPERRRERNRTVKEVYSCEECGTEGRRFNQQKNGTIQFSGALR